jgi:NAD(P)-dependent dehydrogenase (short-subunit alcohol dehydrogenase family)
MELFSLKGKTAIVIGGSKGLGKGMSAGLAQAGANVVLCSRKKPDLDAAAAELSEKTGNGNIIGIPQDITSLEGISALVAQTIETYGQIDILINGAGINVRKQALDFTEADWDQVQNTQLKYVFFMSQAVARHMREKKIRGRIINIASLTSQLGLPNMISYCCAKGAVVQMTKALANELAADGINVNAIGPGYYETEMTKPLFEDKVYLAKLLSRIPAGRTGYPEDLAGAAVFLASDASSYMTGQVVYVDGGWLAS